MALIVEDGTGKSDAESYVSVADCITYADNRGLTFSSSTTALQEQSLRRATVWIDGEYRNRFTGYRNDGRDQALEWPRSSGQNQSPPYGSIANDAVPQEVINASCEAAVRELATPGQLTPDVTMGKVQKSVRVVGAVAVEYAASNGIAAQTPTMTIVSKILFNVLLPAAYGVMHSARGG